VIGWDEGRTSVTDMGRDYLPVLSYAVRDPANGNALHERRDGALHRLEHDQAVSVTDVCLNRRECAGVEFIPENGGAAGLGCGWGKV
jgi:hypothetical protein